MRRRIRLLALAAMLAVAAASSAATPSFDCAAATAEAEKLVCGEPPLAQLDRELADLYAAAEKSLPADGASAERVAQRAWVARRNACGKSGDARDCIATAYRQRIVALQIALGRVEPMAKVNLVCKGRESTPASAAFYATAPPSAVLTYGGQRVTAFVAPSGSGSRYTADGVQYWEHQGSAALEWKGEDLDCALRTVQAAP